MISKLWYVDCYSKALCFELPDCESCQVQGSQGWAHSLIRSHSGGPYSNNWADENISCEHPKVLWTNILYFCYLHPWTMSCCYSQPWLKACAIDHFHQTCALYILGCLGSNLSTNSGKRGELNTWGRHWQRRTWLNHIETKKHGISAMLISKWTNIYIYIII